MSGNGATRLLLIILVISSARYGTPLECYVCTSVENSACTSSLSGIERSTCTLDGTSEITLASTVSTTTLDSDSTSSTTDVTSTGDSSAEYTSTSDSVISTTTSTDDSTSSMQDTTEYSSTLDSETTSGTENSFSENTSLETSTKDLSATTIEERTSSATSTKTESTTDASTTSQDTTTREATSSAVSETITTISNEGSDTENEENADSDTGNELISARMVRDADVAFACYTLTVIKDNETVTDRGCVVKSSSMCETLNEEIYPGYNLTTCVTCTEDGCNSSAINLSTISSLFIPLIIFILTR